MYVISSPALTIVILPKLLRGVLPRNAREDLLSSWMIILKSGQIIYVLVNDDVEILCGVVCRNVCDAESFGHPVYSKDVYSRKRQALINLWQQLGIIKIIRIARGLTKWSEMGSIHIYTGRPKKKANRNGHKWHFHTFHMLALEHPTEPQESCAATPDFVQHWDYDSALDYF